MTVGSRFFSKTHPSLQNPGTAFATFLKIFKVIFSVGAAAPIDFEEACIHSSKFLKMSLIGICMQLCTYPLHNCKDDPADENDSYLI